MILIMDDILIVLKVFKLVSATSTVVLLQQCAVMEWDI